MSIYLPCAHVCFVVIGESIEATNYTEASGAREWNINKFCSLFKRISGLGLYIVYDG